jgi:hypothetical protein
MSSYSDFPIWGQQLSKTGSSPCVHKLLQEAEQNWENFSEKKTPNQNYIHFEKTIKFVIDIRN